MRQVIIVILFLFFLIEAYSQTISLSGEITENTLWNADTIILTDNVVVLDSVNLTISAGVTVLAYEQKYLEIQGSLTAIGDLELPILFSAFDTLGFSDTTIVNGTWGGIHFINLNEHSDSSVLENCVIEYGGAYGEEILDKSGGGVFIDKSSRIRISNCVIQNNFAQERGGGVFIYENSDVDIFHSLIQNNRTGLEGGGIMTMENSFPRIEYNLIINNLALICSDIGCTGRGGGVLVTTLSDEGAVLIRSNIICNNYSKAGGGVYESSFNTQVVSNIICNNRGAGIYTGNSISNSYYINNTIVNNREEGIWANSLNVNIISKVTKITSSAKEILS